MAHRCSPGQWKVGPMNRPPAFPSPSELLLTFMRLSRLVLVAVFPITSPDTVLQHTAPQEEQLAQNPATLCQCPSIQWPLNFDIGKNCCSPLFALVIISWTFTVSMSENVQFSKQAVSQEGGSHSTFAKTLIQSVPWSQFSPSSAHLQLQQSRDQMVPFGTLWNSAIWWSVHFNRPSELAHTPKKFWVSSTIRSP